MFKTAFKISFVALASLSFFVISCKNEKITTDEDTAKLSVPFEKYELENGLDVILHQDKSDPIVSLAIQYG
ncbi:MAG: hypothetical protein KDC64_09255, partial [Aequorivita sp.]|nr:hypothetical protein [Aequorivita sp.]